MSTYNLKRGHSNLTDLADVVASASFVVGAEATNAINIVIQLKKWDGSDLTVSGAVLAYLSGEAAGGTLASAPQTGIAIGTDGLMIETLADQAFWLISETDGDIDVTIPDTGKPTFYLVLVLPNGRLAVSGAITFA